MRLRSSSTVRDGTRRIYLLSALVLFSSCRGDDLAAPESAMGPTVAGRVTASASGAPVAGAQVSIGATTVTTAADGGFVLTNLTPGAATLRGVAAGFEPFEVEISISRLNNKFVDMVLTRFELTESRDFVVYVPAKVWAVRGVLIALGGPSTRGFATAEPFDAPLAAVEESLQELGRKFRSLAVEYGLAVIGTSLPTMPNSPESDATLIAVLREAAEKLGRPDLASAPIVLYGISGGGPEASGFTSRNPGRSAGVVLKTPAGAERVSTYDVLKVPTLVVLTELDDVADNVALRNTFEANRRAGGLWGIALEPGAAHHSLSIPQRELTAAWIADVLQVRRASGVTPPFSIDETGGYLGDNATGETASWVGYQRDRYAASWLPSGRTPRMWASFVKEGALPDVTVLVTPAALTVRSGAVEYFDITVLNEIGEWVEPAVTVTSDSGVAEVSLEEMCPMDCRIVGRVKGVAPGVATISVAYLGATATVSVRVVP